MTVTGNIDILESATLRRGDLRDPLGIWAFRGSVVGDVTSGIAKAFIGLPGGRRAAHVYNVIFVSTSADLAGTSTHTVRILTNWPPADAPGINGASFIRTTEVGSAGIGAGFEAVGFRPLIDPQMSRILMFDPRPDPLTRINILEMWLSQQVDLALHSFEGWGYFWDRGVMDIPGGPRFPGSA